MSEGNLIQVSFGKPGGQNMKMHLDEDNDEEGPVLDCTSRFESAKGVLLQRLKIDKVTVAQGCVAIRFSTSKEEVTRLRSDQASVQKFFRRVRRICLPEISGAEWRVRQDYRITVRFLEDDPESIRLYFYVEDGADTEQTFSQPLATLTVAV